MDTKSRKTHSILHIVAIAIILVAIIMPASILVALYPQMEEEAEYIIEDAESTIHKWIYADIPINSVGHLISLKIDSIENEDVKDTLVGYLNAYGINESRQSVEENGLYFIDMDGKIYTNVTGKLYGTCNNMLQMDLFGNVFDEALKENGINNYFVIAINGENHYSGITADEVVLGDVNISRHHYFLEEYIYDFYSFNEFKNVIPECKAIYMVRSDSGYIQDEYDYVSREDAYEETGALYIIITIMIIIAVVAFMLPFVKFLETGYERIFCLPLVAEIIIGTLFVFGGMGMYYLMAYSPGPVMEFLGEQFFDGQNFEIIGFKIDEAIIYYGILAVNCIGWIVVFTFEYMTFTALHQIICHPVKHFRERTLTAKFIAWFKEQYEKFNNEIIQVELRKGMKKKITVILVANFIIVTILCSLWFFGIIGLIIYTVILMVAAIHIAKKIQDKYDKALHAAEQMGEGNLKIKIDDDLGIFSDLGEKLEKIQEGFKSAVVEEAKSQNMKTELITNVSHDLKTPLTAIITYVNLLKDENITEEERRQYIDTLDMKSQRLKSLIEDLFEISKANSGNVQMNYMDVDIVGLVKQVRLEMEDKIADSSLSFRWNLPEEKIILSLDSQRTYRIYENLLVNVLKYSLDGSRVYVDVEESENDVKVVMKNVSKTELNFEPEYLTERFVRGDASRNSEGSGLGLAIVKSFVELQEGKFYIETDGDLFKAVTIWPKNR